MIFHSLVADDRLSEGILNIDCSNHLLNEFLIRHGLSFGRARAARGPEIKDEELHLYVRIELAREDFHREHLVKLDESNWHLVMVGDEVVGEIGSEVASNYTIGDAKANFTLLASICTDDSCVPLILIVGNGTGDLKRRSATI
jgi:hypothetical protein